MLIKRDLKNNSLVTEQKHYISIIVLLGVQPERKSLYYGERIRKHQWPRLSVPCVHNK